MIYIALFQKSFQRMMTYRAATIAGIATNFFFGLLRAYLFIAVFEASGQAQIGGYTLRDAITYTALTQAIGTPIAILSWWWEVMRAIRSGEIVSDLTKPFHYFGFWLARDVGRATFHFIFRGLPIFLFFPFFFELTLPSSVTQWGLFFLSVVLAVFISFCWRFLVNLSAFWFLDAMGIGRFAWLVMTFLSGFIVPVAFFPEWLKFAVALTPLPAMINTPIEVYLGIAQGAGLWMALGSQLAWAIGMALLCAWVYRRGVQKLIIQGG